MTRTGFKTLSWALFAFALAAAAASEPAWALAKRSKRSQQEFRYSRYPSAHRYQYGSTSRSSYRTPASTTRSPSWGSRAITNIKNGFATLRGSRKPCLPGSSQGTGEIRSPASAQVKQDPGSLLQRLQKTALDFAGRHTQHKCWKWVKQAMARAGLPDLRNQQVINQLKLSEDAQGQAKHGVEAMEKLNMVNIADQLGGDPCRAPGGALVFWSPSPGSHPAGHAEIRVDTTTESGERVRGFASDFFRSDTIMPGRKLLGVYVPAGSHI
jgi:hypothetical protein